MTKLKPLAPSRPESLEVPAVETGLPPLKPDGHSRWLNRTPRGIRRPVGNIPVAYWPPGITLLLPNRVAQDALALGLTFKGEVG